MFKCASVAAFVAATALLAVPAAAIPTGSAAPKVESFNFCARPIMDSYTQQTE